MEQLLYITIYYKQISAKHHPEITLFEILGILFGVAIPLISDMPLKMVIFHGYVMAYQRVYNGKVGR